MGTVPRPLMLWTGVVSEKTMKKFFKKTFLWVFAIPFLSLLLGASLNQLVLFANNDRFPVMMNSAKINEYKLQLEKAAQAEDEQAIFFLEALQYGYLDDVHIIMTPRTHLNFLADWIDLKDATYSPGDLLISLGETGLGYAPVVWIVLVTGRLIRKENNGDNTVTDNGNAGAPANHGPAS